MNRCGFCGQSNSTESRFCVDCGKPLGDADPATSSERPLRASVHRRPSPSVVRSGSAEVALSIVPATRLSGPMVACRSCTHVIDGGLPFCPHCGTPVAAAENRPSSPKRTLVFSAKRRDATAQLVVLDETGQPKFTVAVDRQVMTLGRRDCDIAFPDDEYLSPKHAEFTLRDGGLYVRDLDSVNRTWVFLEESHPLQEDDLLLVGSQVLQFRLAPGHADGGATEEGTLRIGSLVPALDVALLAQVRADGTVRDIFHLAGKRATVIGRDTGDWLFPYDQTMSGRHAEVRAADGAFVIEDLGSRNGIAVAVRGERLLRPGTRLLLGDQVLRVERV